MQPHFSRKPIVSQAEDFYIYIYDDVEFQP